MDPKLREAVRTRAKGRCEYCHLPLTHSLLPFEVEHILATKHGGETVLENLALACRYCNSYKGPNIAGVDPTSRNVVPLFNPRRELWREHFRWDGPKLVGLTPAARATIAVLRINHPEMLAVRESLLAEKLSLE
jgi:hypothetical protein